METQSMARELPKITIEGTEFTLDIRLNELRQSDAPWNRISLDEFKTDIHDKTWLAYDTATKNVYQEIIDPDNIPSNVRLVVILPLIELDPVGMARKYGLPDDGLNVKRKCNQIIVQDKNFKKKLRKGFRL